MPDIEDWMEEAEERDARDAEMEVARREDRAFFRGALLGAFWSAVTLLFLLFLFIK